MTTPTPGTIPAMTEYQPDQLPLAGTEAFEIVSTMDPDTAATYALLVKDAVGKAAGVMSDANPVATDRIVIFRGSTVEYFSALVGNLNQPAGNLPVAGATGQFLQKNSGTNYDASWVNIASAIAGQTGIVNITGSTSLVVGIATAGIGSTQIGTNAVQNANFRQSGPLSVVGVAGAATANVADIAAAGGTLVLQSNAGGTGLLFTTVIAALPGPLKVTTLPLGVVVGLGTTAVTVAAVTAPGAILIDQGTASVPSFRAVTSDLSISANGTATIATGVVSYAKMQNATGLSVLGVAGTAVATIAALTGGTGQVLAVAAGGTSLGFTGAPYIATSLVVGVATSVATGVVLANTFLRSFGGFKICQANFNITTTTLTSVANLSAALQTSSQYFFDAVLYCTAGSTGGTKVAVGYTGTTSSFILDAEGFSAGAYVGGGRTTGTGTAVTISTAAVAPTIFIKGTIFTNNAGTLTVQVAQQASTTATTVVSGGSTLNIVQAQG